MMCRYMTVCWCMCHFFQIDNYWHIPLHRPVASSPSHIAKTIATTSINIVLWNVPVFLDWKVFAAEHICLSHVTMSQIAVLLCPAPVLLTYRVILSHNVRSQYSVLQPPAHILHSLHAEPGGGRGQPDTRDWDRHPGAGPGAQHTRTWPPAPTIHPNDINQAVTREQMFCIMSAAATSGPTDIQSYKYQKNTS